jgi:hypothetical protein
MSFRRTLTGDLQEHGGDASGYEVPIGCETAHHRSHQEHKDTREPSFSISEGSRTAIHSLTINQTFHDVSKCIGSLDGLAISSMLGIENGNVGVSYYADSE